MRKISTIDKKLNMDLFIKEFKQQAYVIGTYFGTFVEQILIG